MIEVDSITIQLTFTKPSLVSAKEMDKIVVTVRKEIFADHISSIDKDQLVFIDSGSVDRAKKLKVPKQLTQE